MTGALCWAYARRKFFELVNIAGNVRKIIWLDPVPVSMPTNSLLGPERSGYPAAAMYFLIVTAKMSDIDPEARLADVLIRLPHMPVSRAPEFLPWSWQAGSLAKAA